MKEVHSHPMALLQCKVFFESLSHIKLVESNDTAEVAMEIQKKKTQGIGAIASKSASEIYGLTVLNTAIQTIKNNVTRFVIIEKSDPKTSEAISIAAWKFILDHKRG
ncbi:MAG: prephenate dehydratase domain-containing protein, partial [Flavobacteriales bacterium]